MGLPSTWTVNRKSVERAVATGLESIKARQAMRLSVWAAEHFYLSAESSYVEQSWEAYPFQTAIMDAMSNDAIEEVTIRKSARVGYTKILLAFAAYNAHQRRRNQGIWQPTDEDADDFCKTELEPMLRDVSVMADVFPTHLQRHKDNTLKQKRFLGSVLHLRGGKAAKNYRRLTLDVVMLDELDGFDLDIEKEGSPVKLASKRLEGATYPKLIGGSTPKIKGFSHVESREDQADKFFQFYIPCPHCGGEHTLTFGGRDEPHGFKWRDNDPETVAHLCPHCGVLMTQAQYFTVWKLGRFMASDGTWIDPHVPDDKEQVFRDSTGMEIAAPRHIAFHIWTAYSPQAAWSGIVREWLSAVAKLRAGDKGEVKTFTNTTLGQTYEEEVEQADENELKKRAEPFKLRTCPRGVLVLCAGVDVQDNRFEVTVWGFGQEEEMWTVDYTVLEANPALDADWAKLDEYLRSTFQHESGQMLGLEAVAVDTGGHFTHQVYRFCRARVRRRVFAIRGEPRMGMPIKGRGSMVDVNDKGKIIKKGVKLWHVGTDTAKDLFFGRLKVMESGPGRVHFSNELPDSFFSGITAEARVLQKTAQGEVHRWVKHKSNARNEPLDTTVYAIFAAHAIDLHRYTAKMWERLRSVVEPSNGDLFIAGPAAPAGSIGQSLPAPVAPTGLPPRASHPPQDAGFGSEDWSL